MNCESTMNAKGMGKSDGRLYAYSRANWYLQAFILFPLFTGVLVFSCYLIVSGTGGLDRNTVAGLIGIALSSSIVGGVLYNFFQLGTIIVNDHQITSLKRTGPISIPWSEIEVIYYQFSGGRQDPSDPYFSVYIFSKDQRFIALNRNFERIAELMDLIRHYAGNSPVKEVPFGKLVKIIVRHYLWRGEAARAG